MEGEKEKLHIVMFPWLAFGHLIPFLDLSKRIANEGHKISFISTPRNIQRLPKIPPNLSYNIDLVTIPLPPVDGLPAEAEATIDLPADKVQYLKKAMDHLEEPFSGFLQTSSPDWIICDFCHHWIPPMAAKLGLPSAFFSVLRPSLFCFFGPTSLQKMRGIGTPRAEQLTVVPPWISFPTKEAYRFYEAPRICSEIETINASGVSDTYRIRSTMEGINVVEPRSCMEDEPEWLNLLPKLYDKPVVPVGLLPPSLEDTTSHGDWIEGEWPNQRPYGSVVYVAFGCEARLSQEHAHGLALGLELSGLPFVWALGSSPDEPELLPQGFKDRTKGRGLVLGWVSQIRLLAHPSVGGFLTHGGCSSIIEGLAFGKPFVVFPIFVDQGLNARIIEEKKMGIEIPRNEMDGTFTKEEVAKTLRSAMVEEEGNQIRAKAREMREPFSDNDLHQKYVADFARYLTEHRHG